MIGNHALAAQIFQAVLTDMTERFRSPLSETIWIRAEMAECLAEADDLPAAMAEWERAVHEASITFGRLESTWDMVDELPDRFTQRGVTITPWGEGDLVRA